MVTQIADDSVTWKDDWKCRWLVVYHVGIMWLTNLVFEIYCTDYWLEKKVTFGVGLWLLEMNIMMEGVIIGIITDLLLWQRV